MTDCEKLIDILLKRPYYCNGVYDVADYLLQNDIIVLPCKIGDTVYRVDRYEWCDIDECYRCFTELQEVECKHHYVEYKLYETKFKISFLNDIGKTVFLTREEAEKALEELKKR